MRTLMMFEKEKGGTGSTGSLVSWAHHYIVTGVSVAFIEASLTQRDVMNAYGGHHSVVETDLAASDAADQIIDAVLATPEDARILVNVPGGKIDVLEPIHDMIALARKMTPEPFDVRIIWTMGLDAASRTTLDALLDSPLPGPPLLNLPAWWGEFEKYTNVDDDLMERIAVQDGVLVQMPSMPDHLYAYFQQRQIATDLIASQPGISIGNRVALKGWENSLAAALEGLV